MHMAISVRIVGVALSPNELINPKSKISGNIPVLRDTTHWFLDMQKHEKWLKKVD